MRVGIHVELMVNSRVPEDGEDEGLRVCLSTRWL